jgi:hypothetical protein
MASRKITVITTGLAFPSLMKGTTFRQNTLQKMQAKKMLPES